MEQRISRFRLTSTAFRRSDEENQIDPKRIIILSVEGSETERAYFQHLNRHLDGAVLASEKLETIGAEIIPKSKEPIKSISSISRSAPSCPAG